MPKQPPPGQVDASPAVTAFLGVLAVFALFAIYAGVTGGTLAFFVVFGLGIVLALGVAGVTVLFTSVKR